MSELAKLLSEISFGSRTAEAEEKDLARYFVETSQWSRISSGQKDVVYGAKGSGKSAIYAVLLGRREEFDRRGIVLKAAEQTHGEPIFTEVAMDPPESEAEWRILWRASFIGLVADVFTENAVESEAAKEVLRVLEEQDLRQGNGPKAWLKSARGFARRIARAENLEAQVTVDPASGVHTIGGKIKLEDRESDSATAAAAVASLLENADKALVEAGLEVWILLDRLDAAFSDPLVESPAIRALMRAYLDLAKFQRIRPKIFLRDDIWEEIVDKSVFREGSHVVRDETIFWTRDTLLNLAIRRALENPSLLRHFNVDASEVLADVEKQERLFEALFEKGRPEEDVLGWAIDSISDGKGRSAPRELIHLLTELRDREMERLQVGRPEPADGALFDVEVRSFALEEVSRTHLERTLYAEIPKIKDYVEALRGGPAHLSKEELKKLWEDEVDSIDGLLKTLVNVGFLRRLSGSEAGFEVAMLYRPALELFSEGEDHGS